MAEAGAGAGWRVSLSSLVLQMKTAFFPEGQATTLQVAIAEAERRDARSIV